MPVREGWLIDARELVILSLFAFMSILLAAAAVGYTVQAHRKITHAQVIVARADSLLADWATRSCVPRRQP